MIQVTKTYLPPFSDYVHYLEGIWERRHLTNNGPLVQDLERKLKEYLGVRHLSFVNNGTVALQIAIKALGLKEEIITTPFSYVATTSCIVWEGCTPVFVDIDPDTLTINPALIEAAITPRTSAILATHVYGNPCDVEAIEAIAQRHQLKVIYDAAHAFGTQYKGRSVLEYGDVSTLSFHATKLFHTTEGGAIVARTDAVARIAEYQRRFGHNGPEDFHGIGINGKNSEFHAAMGLCILPKVDEFIERRKRISELYDHLLLATTSLRRPALLEGTTYNYAYYPVIFPSEKQLITAIDALKKADIVPRRYFYPSLNTLSYVHYRTMPVSEDIASRIACLPLYIELSEEDVNRIATTILATL